MLPVHYLADILLAKVGGAQYCLDSDTATESVKKQRTAYAQLNSKVRESAALTHELEWRRLDNRLSSCGFRPNPVASSRLASIDLLLRSQGSFVYTRVRIAVECFAAK